MVSADPPLQQLAHQRQGLARGAKRGLLVGRQPAGSWEELSHQLTEIGTAPMGAEAESWTLLEVEFLWASSLTGVRSVNFAPQNH